MDILYAVAEIAPFSKVGGLADVAGALPKELVKDDIHIQVISPLYGVINRKQNAIESTDISGSVQMGKKSYPYQIATAIPDNDLAIEYLFISNAFFFDREGIYTQSDGEGFPDNNARFFFFQRIVVDLISKGYIQPDLVHLNDHHTALITLLLKTRNIPIPVLLTVHNFQYQGEFGADDLKLLAKSDSKAIRDQFSPRKKQYNALKIGLMTANHVNTVSPTYAAELLKRNNPSFGLSRTLKSIQAKFSGILNGVDYSLWNPQKDPYLNVHFSPTSLKGKAGNKKLLQERCGLPADTGIPVIGSVSRLVESKGFDIILTIIDNLMKQDIQIVFLGTGSKEIEKALNLAAIKYSENISFYPEYNEELAHLIEAGSDMYLMPSRFEPCGLNQIYSQKYGTIPIVHKTGGLADTVYNWDGKKGTGFVFETYDHKALLKTIKRALTVFKDGSQWKQLMKNAMMENFSWSSSAQKYLHLYQQLIQNKPQ